MPIPTYKSVVVLGAGPAGLAVGRELKLRGVDCVILDKASCPGESFRNFPTAIHLGPWLNNTLPGSTVAWLWLLRRTKPSAYARYLAEYARNFKLPLHLNTSVQRVVQTSKGFSVVTSHGTCDCDAVVNATGYFNKPYVPDYPGLATTSIPWIHVAKYRNPDTVRPLGRRVLIVGRRVSAGETMIDLARAGFEVELSHRSPLKFALSPTLEALFSPIAALVEKISLKLKLRPDSYPPMAGGETQRLISSGQVKTRPDIERIEGKSVVFSDGTQQSYDFIIFATGYRAVMDHLESLILRDAQGDPEMREMESTRTRGLFFMGVENQRTYRSRFLRGIRRDAPRVAELVAQRLPSLANRRERFVDEIAAVEFRIDVSAV